MICIDDEYQLKPEFEEKIDDITFEDWIYVSIHKPKYKYTYSAIAYDRGRVIIWPLPTVRYEVLKCQVELTNFNYRKFLYEYYEQIAISNPYAKKELVQEIINEYLE